MAGRLHLSSPKVEAVILIVQMRKLRLSKVMYKVHTVWAWISTSCPDGVAGRVNLGGKVKCNMSWARGGAGQGGQESALE